MRTMSLSNARFNMAGHRLRQLFASEPEPVALTAGRGPHKERVAVLLPYSEYVRMKGLIDGFLEAAREEGAAT